MFFWRLNQICTFIAACSGTLTMILEGHGGDGLQIAPLGAGSEQTVNHSDLSGTSGLVSAPCHLYACHAASMRWITDTAQMSETF
jgi:hypothetical protein